MSGNMWFNILKKDFSDVPEVIEILERMGFTAEEVDRGIEFHNDVAKGVIMWRGNKEEMKDMLRRHSIPPEYNWDHDQIKRFLTWELDKLSRAEDRWEGGPDEAYNRRRRHKIQEDLKTLQSDLFFKIRVDYSIPTGFGKGEPTYRGNNLFRILDEFKNHLVEWAKDILDDGLLMSSLDDKYIKWAKEMVGEA